MSDFMDGDQFPDRPDHPDFWKLSDIVLMLDGRLEDNRDPVEQVLSEIGVDQDSLIYMLTQRCHGALLKIQAAEAFSGPLAREQLMQAGWLEGFMVGVLYARKDAS